MEEAYHDQYAFSTHYASTSPKAELEVQLFLNVGHHRGGKVITSGTSVKINIFFFLPMCLRSFIHCTTAELTLLYYILYSLIL